VRLQTVAGKTHSANPSKSSFGLNAYMSSCWYGTPRCLPFQQQDFLVSTSTLSTEADTLTSLTDTINPPTVEVICCTSLVRGMGSETTPRAPNVPLLLKHSRQKDAVWNVDYLYERCIKWRHFLKRSTNIAA
jgi:hypothetical protein